MQQNLVALVDGSRNIHFEKRNIPQPKHNEVLIKISSVGICGSDLKYWAYGRCGRFDLNGSKMVIGHEAGGVVVSVGRSVNHLKPGDKIAIEPGIPCKSCEVCHNGRYNLCGRMRFCATPPIDGNLCKYYLHDADFCYKVPDNITTEEAAMMEPLSVAVYACQRGQITLGDTVAIFGAGPVGILCGMVAKTRGASKICIVDIDDERLDVAMKLGAAHTTHHCSVKSTENSEQLADDILSTLGSGIGPHCSIECSGADSSLRAGIHLTRPGGSVVMVGRGSMSPAIPMVCAATKEVDILGVFRYANNYPQAMALISSGAIDVKPLITHRFALEESRQAFETAVNSKERAIKVMINCE